MEERTARNGLRQFDCFIETRYSGLVSSQIVEDFFNHAKSGKVRKSAKKLRRPERASGIILS